MQRFTRISLTFVAGFCDTATFVHMNEVFSAHVTGNFVLFAAAVAGGLEEADYLKIVTFPVFLLGVVIATLAYGKAQADHPRHTRLLGLITCLLIGCAMTAVWLEIQSGSDHLGRIDIAITLLLVTAMAMQNTIHYFFSGPMTTVMTGTVMHATASFAERWLLGRKPAAKAASASVNPLWMILSFAFGCIIAAFAADRFGLACIALPALLMIIVWALELHCRKKERRHAS